MDDYHDPRHELAAIEGRDYDGHYRLSLEDRHGLLVLNVAGRVMREIPEDFADQVIDLLHDHFSPRVMLDLDECEYISSSALGYLVRFFREASVRGRQVLALQPSERIASLLEILGLDEIIIMVDDEEAALRFYESQGI